MLRSLIERMMRRGMVGGYARLFSYSLKERILLCVEVGDRICHHADSIGKLISRLPEGKETSRYLFSTSKKSKSYDYG